jgi:predicted metal-dependent hydrolase
VARHDSLSTLNVDLSRGFGCYWLGGDVWRTAFMNALSMSFPLGEQMFIDCVRAVPSEAIVDPALRAEVKDFVGQEASHRFVHEQVNAELARQGYPYTLGGTPAPACAARSFFGRRGIAWALFVPALHYLSPRFNPWQHDNCDLLRLWLERNDGAYRAIASTPS